MSRETITYKVCLEKAKLYEYKQDFMRECNNLYVKALKKGWMNKFDWLKNKRLCKETDKIDCVYAYEFVEFNSVYVGRTLMKRKHIRHREHKSSSDTVANFIRHNKIKNPKMIILEENLTIEEGVNKEAFWVEKYKNDGWNILNIAKTGSIGKIGSNRYTYEECYNEALKYKCVAEFERNNKNMCTAARYHGWLNDYVWFEKRWEHKWTKEACYNEALKYKTLTDFMNKNHICYSMAIQNGWVDDYVWLERKYVKRGYWQNYENCYNEALKYTTMTDFMRKCGGAYNSALKHGWTDDYVWLLGKAKKHGYWQNYENCYNEALKYTNMSDFEKGSCGAYQSARVKGWTKDYFWFIRKK